MGDYTEAADIRKLYKKIDTSGLVDNDFDFYIKMAESEVKGYIAKRYGTTFDPVPTLIRNISTELALIKILERFFTQEARSENSWVVVRRENLIDILEQIRDGEMSLIDESGNIISEDLNTSGLSSSTSTYTPTFGHGSPTKEVIDCDRLSDEEDART